MGNPFDEDTQMGPVISANSKVRIAKMVDAAVLDGAKLRTGGCEPDLPDPFNRCAHLSFIFANPFI